MNHLVITFVGEDKVGIVESIAQLVYEHQGNWLASSMSHLAGQFAGIIEISISDEQTASLKQQVEQIDGLTFSFKDGQVENASVAVKHLILSLTANDRPGILKQVTQVLSQANVNLIQIDTDCVPAANWGSPLFSATIKADVSEATEVDDLKESVEAIADDIMIDCELVQRF